MNRTKKSLKQKLAVALSVVNALNVCASIAMPYVNVARNVRAGDGVLHTCHSCANDQRNKHVYEDFGACPHHRGTEREFECTRCIAPDFVKKVIGRLRKDRKKGETSV